VTLPRERLLGSRYELRALLGIGGMAEVFLATDTRLDRDVAVKVLRADLARDPTFRQRFRREAQAAGSLSDPSIVAVYDTGEDTLDGARGVPWIVMEHVPGRTLREVLDQEGRLLPRRALEVVADVCSALQLAHAAGIVHRDVKPGNVMLTPAGEVKVMDFGIARAVAGGSQTMTQTAAVIGTAAYLSPEQARGEHVDGRSDVYSAGCLLYELLTGSPPFSGDSPVAVAYQHVREDPAPVSRSDGSLGPDVDAVVLKALAKNPANRYQSAALMGEDLLRAANGQPVEATPVLLEQPGVLPVASVRVPRPARRRAALVYGLFCLLLLAVVLGVALAVRSLQGGGTALVAAPAVEGLSQRDAETRLAAAGLTVGEVQPRYAAEPLGTVLAQAPVAGLLVGARSVVDLTVSQGVQLTRVPRVRQLSRQDAEAQLRDAELAVSAVIERNGTSARGTVLRVLPGEGKALPAGGTVALVVASGNAAVPSVVGQVQQIAVQRLQEAGFDVGVSFSPDAGPAGRVLSQVPAGGAAQVGSTVVLAVSQQETASSPPTPTASPTPMASSSPSAPPTPGPSPTSAPPAPSPTPSATRPPTAPPVLVRLDQTSSRWTPQPPASGQRAARPLAAGR